MCGRSLEGLVRLRRHISRKAIVRMSESVINNPDVAGTKAGRVFVEGIFRSNYRTCKTSINTLLPAPHTVTGADFMSQ